MGVTGVVVGEPGGLAAERPGMLAVVRRDLRRLAAVVLAGAIGGSLVGGVGSRLAMLVIAALNRDQTGRLTDDGAVMGRFVLAETAGLVGLTTILGVLGGVVYLAVRDLRIGPPWFRTVSIVAGPAVVVGAALVHRDGVDFTILQPAALSIGLFVAIPAGYAALVCLLADRWLAPGAWPERAPWWVIAPLVAPALLFLPVGVPVVGGWSVRQAILRWRPTRRLWDHPVRAWAARAGLAVIFGFAGFNLITETIDLV